MGLVVIFYAFPQTKKGKIMKPTAFMEQVRHTIQRLTVVEEFLNNGATVKFSGGGFCDFSLDTTESRSLSVAYLENKKRDVGLLLHRTGADLGKKVAFEVYRHPVTGMRGTISGILNRIYYQTEEDQEHVPYFEIVSQEGGLGELVTVKFDDIIDIMVGNYMATN